MSLHFDINKNLVIHRQQQLVFYPFSLVLRSFFHSSLRVFFHSSLRLFFHSSPWSKTTSRTLSLSPPPHKKPGSRKRMVPSLHSDLSDNKAWSAGPAVTSLLLTLKAAQPRSGLLWTAPGILTDHGAVGGRDNLLGAGRQLDAGLPGVRVV